MGRFERTMILTLGCICWFAAISGGPSVWAQLKPELDAKVPTYHPLGQASGSLVVAGSESMKPLVEAWTSDLKRWHSEIKVKVTGDGSQTGLAALLEHRSDVAAMSRRMTSAEIGEFVKEYGFEPTEVPVAGDAVAVFVHRDNPITGLSLDELDAMFCRERRRGLSYPIDSWGLVGLTDEWFEAPVHLYGRNGKSGTAYLFREEVCKGGTFRPQLVGGQGSASVVMDVSKDPHGIGLSAIGYQISMVKAVPLASVKGGRYVGATFETAMDGSYPLRRNLYLYLAKPPKTAPASALAELVRFALSAQGQQAALNHGYFPLSLTEISRILSKWSAPVKAAQLPPRERTPVE